MAQASVIIRPNQNLAKEWKGRLAESSQDLFAKSCASEARKSKRLIRSSFSGPEAPGAPEAALTTVSPSTNGLVKGIFEAYSGHHHLILRPEDIWFAILSQFSFYVNAHAEELRSLFVAHEGQEEITVYAVGNIDSVDIGGLAIDLTHEMEKHIVDESLRTWIIPSFTTTTTTDLITASILMMGTMQAYFKYTMMLLCGIPSITLLGGKEDWLDIRRRLEKLATFGEECELFGRLLIPVLDHLVLCFDSVDDPAVYDFWNKVCSHKFAGSGGDRLSGWITAFCFWDEKGKMLYWKQKNHDSEFSDIDVSDAHLFDASIYHSVGIDKIPPGTVSVPVKVNDNGTVYYTQMVAGSVGMRWTKSGQALDEIGEDHNCIQENESCTSLDTLQPISGWWMYELAATVQSEIQDYGIIIPPEQVSTLREIMSKMYHTNIEVDEPARNDIPYRPMGHKMLQANNHKVILLGKSK